MARKIYGQPVGYRLGHRSVRGRYFWVPACFEHQYTLYLVAPLIQQLAATTCRLCQTTWRQDELFYRAHDSRRAKAIRIL